MEMWLNMKSLRTVIYDKLEKIRTEDKSDGLNVTFSQFVVEDSVRTFASLF